MATENVRALAPRDDAELLERVLLEGDLANLKPADRIAYYNRVCNSLGLNPLTKPFDYLKLNGRLILYAKRDAADQLRKIHRVSVTLSGREVLGDVYVVTARASTADGRSDESTGAVTVKGLGGEALANAYMKAETKAKRRVTLSFVGLGWLDETEVESIRGAQRVTVLEDGAIEGEAPTPLPTRPPLGQRPRKAPHEPLEVHDLTDAEQAHAAAMVAGGAPRANEFDVRLNHLGDPVCHVDRDGRMCGDPVAPWEGTDEHPSRDRFWVAQWQIGQQQYGMPLCIGHQMGLRDGYLNAAVGPRDVMTRAERQDLEGVYSEVAHEAIEREHRHADKLSVTKPERLDDAVLAESTRQLAAWIEAQKASVEPAEAAF